MNKSCTCGWIVVIVLTAGLAPAVANAQSAPADAPPEWVPPSDAQQGRDFFGDANNVRLLGDLLKDDDSTVREKATRDLGQTHNILAMPPLAASAKDKSPDVRAAAVAAATECRLGQYAQIIIDALADQDRTVVMQACQSAVKCNLTQAGDNLVKLLDRSEPSVQLAALESLTALKLPAPVDKLKAALASPSTSVRRQTAINALLLGKQQKTSEIIPDLVVVATKDQPAVREAALAAVGKFAFAPNVIIIEQARKDANPLVRRGAVEAYANAGKADPFKEFLADPSPLVRLAAIRGAGEVKAQDAVDGLFDQLQNADDDLSHIAARQSLAQIGGPAVAADAGKLAAVMYQQALEAHKEIQPAQKAIGEAQDKVTALAKAALASQAKLDAAAEAVKAVGDASTPDKKAKLQAARAQQEQAKKDLQDVKARQAGASAQLADAQGLMKKALRTQKYLRNLRSCFWLLGQLKSDEQLDMRLGLVESSVTAPPGSLIQIDSDVLVEAAESLGLLGDPRAAGALNKLLAELARQAPLKVLDNPPPDCCYSRDVTVATVGALARLKNSQELGAMSALVNIRIKQSGRLAGEVEAVMKALPELVTASNKDQVQRLAAGVAADVTYSIPSRFWAIVDCGKMDVKSSAADIRRALVQERTDMNTMRAAAWAIRRLTGEVVPLGEPVVSQGQWIITTRQR